MHPFESFRRPVSLGACALGALVSVNGTLHAQACWELEHLWPLFTNVTALGAADLNGDGQADVYYAEKSLDRIGWFNNHEGDGSDWTGHLVVEQLNGADSLLAADVDGDGDQDLLAASRPFGLQWYENATGDGLSWIGRTITPRRATEVVVADFDGDGDLDAVSISGEEHARMAWHENRSGDGRTWVSQSFLAEMGEVRSVEVADVDGDGDADVLATSTFAGEIRWYEHDGPTWRMHTIAREFARDLSPGDLDGDGDVDFFAAAYSGIVWYRNLSGDGLSWERQSILEGTRWEEVVAADIDRDGDLDALSTASSGHGGGRVLWHENSGGPDVSWQRRLISDSLAGPRIVVPAELDGRGHRDVLVWVTHNPRLVWLHHVLDACSASPERPCVARAQSRDAGTNPSSYTATAPLLGQDMLGLVDLLGTTGHTSALIVGYGRPANLVLGGGQTLLVDVTDPGGELLGLEIQSGSVGVFLAPVPNDLSMCNYRLSTQAVHFGGVQPFALSNAVDLTLGN